MAKKPPPGMVKRGAVYWADFRCKGRRICKALSGDVRTAGELLTELRARAQRGEFGLLDNDVSLQDIRKQYLRHCEQTIKPQSVARYREALARVLPNLPPKVSQVTASAVRDYRKVRLVDHEARTVNYDVARLSGMLAWAVKDKIIDSNPATTGFAVRREVAMPSADAS